MSGPLLALANMRGNLFAAAIWLVLGIVVLRQLRSPRSTRNSLWLPLAALAAGPLAAWPWLWVDSLVFGEEYQTSRDYLETGWRLFALGLIGGAIAAIVLWIGTNVGSRTNNKESEVVRTEKTW